MLDLSSLFESSPSGLRPSARRIQALQNAELVSKLKEATSWLPADAKIAERIFVHTNFLLSRPVCITCQGQLHPSSILGFKFSQGYKTFCSTKCARTNEDVKHRQKANNLIKYGVEHTFQSGIVKDKIKQKVIERYGVTSSLQLPNVKAARITSLKNRSNATYRLAALKRLNPGIHKDYDWIKDDDLYSDTLEVIHEHKLCKNRFKWRLHDGLSPNCPICYPRSSNISQIHSKITTFLKNNNIEFIENKRTLLPPTKLEIDIFIPSKNIGIEVNGLYWHSEIKKERQLVQLSDNYHLRKTEIAEANGIKMFHFWEHEIQQNFQQLTNFLETKLGFGRKLNARSLTVREVESKDERAFLSQNHLQGHVNSKVCLGLYEQDVLVQLASFGRSRFDKNVEWELLRLSSLKGHIIRGGASKLLTAFKRTYSPISIISYAERRLGSPDVYLKLGFMLARKTSPGYFYWKVECDLRIINRQAAQKHKLNKLLGEQFYPEKTEKQNMLDAGYGMIKDCGQLVYIWTA